MRRGRRLCRYSHGTTRTCRDRAVARIPRSHHAESAGFLTCLACSGTVHGRFSWIAHMTAASITTSSSANRALRALRLCGARGGIGGQEIFAHRRWRWKKDEHGRCARISAELTNGQSYPRKISQRYSKLRKRMTTATIQPMIEVIREFTSSPILARSPVN